MKTALRKLFRVPEKVDTMSHLRGLVFKYVLGINRRVPWPVHFTSRIVAPHKIQLGHASYPGDMPGCYIQGNNGIIIGDNCEFGPGVGLISANHNPLNLDQHIDGEPIRIGNACWIGMHAVILPGVKLGDYTIVGAGSIVTHSFPAGHCIIAGNPAIVVKKLE